ncbi:MAG TPA: DUF4383 domain-containing protein [Bauldia sp.]|nr:DUF4383 domain-containing protein [Bauldia sp.]
MTARTAAIVLGIVFIVVGILGFFNNPVIGIFGVNAAHNIVHLASGAFLLIGAFTPLGSGLALKILGVIYAIIAILGFIIVGEDMMMLGIIMVDVADKWLHVVLAIVLLIAGFGLPDEERRAV